MTIQELYDWCVANDFDLDTPIAIRSKDDYLLVPANIRFEVPYFGNCPHGDDYLKDMIGVNEDGELDYEEIPEFLIFDTGRG